MAPPTLPGMMRSRLAAAVALLGCAGLDVGESKLKNVLFMVSDVRDHTAWSASVCTQRSLAAIDTPRHATPQDMRPELGTYGASHVHSPHLDALAADGMVFDRAYVMISLCMPSRTAFLTSRRPDTTKDYVIGPEYWRATGGPNATTLPHVRASVRLG